MIAPATGMNPGERYAIESVERAPQLSGWLTRFALKRSPASQTSSGNLFAPPDGERRVEGGWRKPAPKPSVLLVASAALLVGGCLLAINRSRGRSH